MKVAELVKALEALPADLEVLIMDGRSYELDEANVDLARRLPPGVPIDGMYDWKWEQHNPDERYTERIVIVY